MRSLEGRSHLGKLHYLDAEELALAYPRLGDFPEVRRRLDPDRLFGNRSPDALRNDRLRGRLLEVKGSPKAVADLVQEIIARVGRGTDDDATFVLTDLSHRLDRYQQKLSPKAASAHLQDVRLVDP
jgi:D-arabinono-1,4-lactone oxidase